MFFPRGSGENPRGCNALPPMRVFAIPVYGFGKCVIKLVRGFPAEIYSGLLRVQTVSVVMSRSVFHINQSRLRPLEQLEQPFSDVPVWQLISCRNIVDLTWISFLNCEVDCTAKVVDEDPIANLSSSAI